MRIYLSTALTLMFCCAARAQENAGSPEESIEVFQAEASAYTFRPKGGGEPFVRRPQPLFQWANPARNGEDGAVFLWTENEIPRVIGTCFTYSWREELRRKHAFHVLTEKPIEGLHGDTVMWTPEANSIRFEPLPGAPPPPANAAQRTFHLRNQARRFRVRVIEKQQSEETRLVPQPLYRYETEHDGTAVSGAIFTHSLGTDPEAMVLIETRPGPDGEPAWHYALARFTFYHLEFFLDERPLVTMERSENMIADIRSRPDYQRIPYITFRAEWLLDD